MQLTPAEAARKARAAEIEEQIHALRGESEELAWQAIGSQARQAIYRASHALSHAWAGVVAPDADLGVDHDDSAITLAEIESRVEPGPCGYGIASPGLQWMRERALVADAPQSLVPVWCHETGTGRTTITIWRPAGEPAGTYILRLAISRPPSHVGGNPPEVQGQWTLPDALDADYLASYRRTRYDGPYCRVGRWGQLETEWFPRHAAAWREIIDAIVGEAGARAQFAFPVPITPDPEDEADEAA